MKKLVLALVLLVAAGCADRDITSSVMTGQKTDLKVLAGTEVAGIGVGAVVAYERASRVDWGPEPDRIGFYVQGEPSWVLGASDTDDPAPFGLTILDGLTAEPYGRIEWLDTADNDNLSNLRPQFIVGTRFLLDEAGTMAIVTEYSDGDALPSDGYIGVSIKF